MKYIKPINSSKLIKVDDDDYEFLSKFHWRISLIQKKEYVTTSVKQKTLYIHRLIMKAPKSLVVDHKNGDTLDNQRSNLRLATLSQNNMNSCLSTKNTSGYKGVYWEKNQKKWVARIKKDRKFHLLGYFPNPRYAAYAYHFAALDLFGDRAKTAFTN